MISAIVFLVVGGTFVFTLLSGLFKLISQDFSNDGLNGNLIWKIFKLTIISFIVLMLYILFVMPYLEANGYEY